jgi:hypothetical protein
LFQKKKKKGVKSLARAARKYLDEREVKREGRKKEEGRKKKKKANQSECLANPLEKKSHGQRN